MRILFLANPLDVHDFKWMTYFSSGHDSALIVRQEHFQKMSSGQKDQFIRDDGIQALWSLRDFSVARPWRTLKEMFRLRGYIKDFSPDIIHVYFAEPNALWALVRSFVGGRSKWVLTTRGTDILLTIPKFRQRNDRLGRLIHWLYRRAFARFDMLVATSQAQILSAQRELGYSGITSVVRTGVDFESLSISRPDLLPASLENRRFIFFPRLMAPVYDQELSLDVIEALPEQIKSEYIMVFVDRDQGHPDYVQMIQSRMQQIQGVRFEFLDRLSPEEVWELYKAAALTVMTPRSDGTPVSAMESLMCGTLVVAPPLDYDPELAKELLVACSRQPGDFVAQIQLGLNRKAQIKPDSAFFCLASRNAQMSKLARHYESLLACSERSSSAILSS
ncbi:glycosyltransferase family 4 protein [bacterium]|nr:glycosyltransferase family 4 protein [bacterium]